MHKDNHNQREATVVVIDDEPIVTETLRKIVATLNPTWSFAAFGTAEEFLASERRFSRCCILLDVNLPGMSGLDLLKILEDRNPDRPVIVMSGKIEQHADQAMRLGAFAVSPKPFDKDFLTHVAEAMAGQKRSSKNDTD